MLPPMVKPSAARQPLIARCVQISPLRTRLTPASITATGAGRIRVDNQPADTDNCHTASNNTGNAQGARVWMIFFMARLSSATRLWEECRWRPSRRTG
jgi:hypothetical protein